MKLLPALKLLHREDLKNKEHYVSIAKCDKLLG